ncbi:tigger transposable element-derived protein 4-like [Belonocnema kinseyi]|uniref:tigger transposable element-derived protein 4-like n=1 Tax=Belonocnema kinseyi TaxID=2817044 RepID=UPI00143D107B|nr:tigger transposable element-derived protein 4-like [Belonocnema kinseyi]
MTDVKAPIDCMLGDLTMMVLKAVLLLLIVIKEYKIMNDEIDAIAKVIFGFRGVEIKLITQDDGYFFETLNSISELETNQSRKRCREATNEKLDGCVTKWFKQARDKKIPVSGPILQMKAQEFVSVWIVLTSRRLMVGCRSSNIVTTLSRRKCVGKKQLSICVDSKDIFNADETTLFYGGLPNKTLAFKGEDCRSSKLSGVRIIVLVGANSHGIVKLPLLTIGKSANPRCFKNVKTKPCEYESNNKAWMTRDIFEKWLLNPKTKEYRRSISTAKPKFCKL